MTEENCKYCQGKGYIKKLNFYANGASENIKCEVCQGTGTVEIED